MENIHNIPAYAIDKKYILARDVDDELWFYVATDDPHKAGEIAVMMNCEVFEN